MPKLNKITKLLRDEKKIFKNAGLCFKKVKRDDLDAIAFRAEGKEKYLRGVSRGQSGASSKLVSNRYL